MEFLTNEKLTIVGAAGMIGSNMAQTAMMMKLTPNICLYDPFAPALEGVAEELYHCGFEGVNLTYTSDIKEALTGASYIVSSGGAARKAGMTREDLLKGNAEIAAQFGKDVRQYCPNVKHIVVIFNPADITGLITLLYSGLKPSQVSTLAALDSIPEITATPAATATPVPTATPTPSLTPVPTILPAFEPENYQGTWYSEDGLTTIDIYDISLKSVSFTYKRINGKNHSLSVEADVTAEVAGNATQFYLKDSDGNKAKGEFVFDKSGEFYVKVKTYKRADGSLTYPKTESIMTREAPAEDAGSTEQENAGTEAASDTSDAETSSGSSTEVNSTDAENASDANAYYSESEDTSSQDDTGIYGIPYGEEETYYTE